MFHFVSLCPMHFYTSTSYLCTYTYTYMCMYVHMWCCSDCRNVFFKNFVPYLYHYW